MIRVLLLLAVAIGIAAPVFLSARDRARHSASTRTRLILGGILGVSAGLVAALWLPQRVPETRGSPASLVGIVLLWVLGGGFAFLSAALLAGALVGKTRNVDPS